MASIRVELSNRLHEAAASPDGLAEIERLVEIEKLDVNQPHTKEGTSPAAFAAKTGSLDTLKYLLERNASIEQPKGKPNLLTCALDTKQNIDKINFIASLYRHFNDGTTKLHAAIACRDLGTINDLIIKDVNSIYIKDNNGFNSIKYAIKYDDFTIAGLLLIHSARTSIKFQNSFEHFLIRITTPRFNPKDKIKYKSLILQMIPIMKPIKSIRAQCSHYALLLIAEYFNPTPNKEEEYKLAREVQNIISSSTESALLSRLARAFFNISVGLDNKDPVKILLFGVVLQLIPNNYIHIEHIFRHVVSTQLALDQGIQPIRKLSDRVLAILDAKKEVKLKEAHVKNSQLWKEDVIRPLIQNYSTREAWEALAIFIRLVLRIAPNETLEDRDFITKLHFIQIQNHLKLGHHEEASRIFSECKLGIAEALNAETINGLLWTAAAFAKNKNFDILLRVRELVTHEKFIECFKGLILDGKFWPEILFLLEALHEKRLLIATFPPNTLIGGIPFIIHLAKANQDESLRFLLKKIPDTLDHLLTSSIPVETGDTQHCTALYFVGIGGDFILFSQLLERIQNLYHPEPTAHTKPFMFALLENAAKDFIKFPQYYKILGIVVNAYPDEINKVWQGETITERLNRLHPKVKICLGPALQSKEAKMQAELESQIQREIIKNDIINPFLSGARVLPDDYLYKNRPEKTRADGTAILRNNIEILDTLIHHHFGTGRLRVSSDFYDEIFWPWKMKYESDASCYGHDGLPAVETRNGMQVVEEINMITRLVHAHFTRSVGTPLIKNQQPSDLICHRNALVTISVEEKKEKNTDPANEAKLSDALEQETKSPLKYTVDTIHPASSSFLKMFKERGELKEENRDEKVIESAIHPAYR